MATIQANRLKEQGFSQDQIQEIQQGAEQNLNVGAYLDTRFSAMQMIQIRLGLEEGLDVNAYNDPKYDMFQMEEIRKGLLAKVDLSVFAKPEIPYIKMRELRKGLEIGHDITEFLSYNAGVMREYRKSLESGVDIREYIEERYDADQLEQIRLSFESGVPIDMFLDKQYCGAALLEIRRGLEAGVDITRYADIDRPWKKMKEIRLGLENQVDVSLYDSMYYTWQQMREIRLGLQQGVDVFRYCRLRYSAAEMRRVRLALLEELKAEANLRRTREAIQEEDYRIIFSTGNMEAQFSYFGDRVKLTRDKLMKLLQKNRIYHGIQEDAIQEIMEGNGPITDVPVAKGTWAQNGKDGWFEYFFRTELNRKPKILEDGSADYMNIEWFEMVEEGQKLAEYHEATKGVDGCSVCGEVLKAKNGIEKAVLKGNGFRIDADRKTYYASITGKIDLAENAMNVSNYIRVDEVTLATGNLVFDGSVHVLGNVENGMKIDVTGDLEIDGFVAGADINCGGSVCLKNGMNANHRGCLKAGKNIVSRYFEATVIEAEGDIRFNTAMNCKMYAKGSIISNSALVGGTAKAEGGFQLHNVGNDAWIPTDIRIVRDAAMFEKYFQRNKRQKDIEHELEVLHHHRNELSKKFSQDSIAEMDVFTKLENAIYTKEMQIKELKKEQKSLESAIHKLQYAKIVIMGQAFIGVHAIAGEYHFRADNQRNIVIQALNGQVTQR